MADYIDVISNLVQPVEVTWQVVWAIVNALKIDTALGKNQVNALVRAALLTFRHQLNVILDRGYRGCFRNDGFREFSRIGQGESIFSLTSLELSLVSKRGLPENCALVFGKMVLISTTPGSPEHDVFSTITNTFICRNFPIIVAIVGGLAALRSVIQGIKLYSVVLCWVPEAKQMSCFMDNRFSKQLVIDRLIEEGS